jgi:glycosyltransferase involved in cell wall biosynthesis
MKKILQITIEVNRNSVGKIAEQIGEVVLQNNWESNITYSRSGGHSKSKLIKIGTFLDTIWHVFETRLFDNHANASRIATYFLIRKIKKIKPDIIHLHHIHGYYINKKILFNFLNKSDLPVVWTFHDCWSFTGHCAYFDYVGCNKWQESCSNCPQIKSYPKSFYVDRSKRNFEEKKYIFNSINNLTIVPVSDWLASKVKESFLKDHSIKVIKNGIDLDVFSPQSKQNVLLDKLNLKGKKIILGVASTWDQRKGLSEFIKLNEILNNDYFQIVLVGLTKNQIANLPEKIIGMEKTNNAEELAEIYSNADVFVNPTLEDTYPTTNLESISCGTPVVTYNTGGSIESITRETGIIIEKYDIFGLKEAIIEITQNGKAYYKSNCRNHALRNFSKRQKFEEYLSLYKEILKINEN